MSNFKMTLQYDGTRYKGWQILKNEDQTIQGKLQHILYTLTGEEIQVIGSGRTDAGVHAIGQVANFHLDADRAQYALKEKGFLNPSQTKEEALLSYLNYYLPDDIAVVSLSEVAERFHARFHCRQKTYRYRIHTSEIANVFENRFVYHYRDLPLDTDRMQQAAELLCGCHDFRSFCGNKHMKKSTERTIYEISIRKLLDEKGLQKEIVIDFTGDGFLQNMVRIMTGTLIEVGSGRRDPASMTELLERKDRSLAGYTVPPEGLSLLKVFY